MSTFMGIETAKRGLNANQIGLNITGNNITNVGTEGYTRQRVDTVAMAASGQQSRYALSQASLAGQGVMVSGIGQVRDSFLDKRYRDQAADLGFYERSVEIMTDLETALDEYASSGLKDALAELYKSFNDLSDNADQAVNANIVLTAAKKVVSVLNSFQQRLDAVKGQQVYSLQIDVNEVNTKLKRLADLNYSISQEVFANSLTTNPGTYGPNELLDERNNLLDQLSKYADIKVESNNDGSIRVKIAGHTAVDGKAYETVNLVNNADGTVSLNWVGSGERIAFGSGSLKAAVSLIDGRGPNATGNETFDKGIPFYNDLVNSFASNLLTEFNRIFPTNNGTTASTSHKTLFTSGGNNIITAGNISVSDQWLRDPAYIIDQSVDRDGEFDNTYILSAISLFSKQISFQGMEGTFEEYVNFYNTSEIGQQISFLEGRRETAATVSNSLLNERDAVSGVSLDEEGTNLLMFQKAYNAVARLMTALDEALDKLINSTGLVGR